ncbi:glyoxalase [Mucilaginibacter sp. PPCGB 2223]|uniref:VOC family protein n=1 Tax=Mucilaginibacter sp. PPCGB 2223 TaxID=1886027 RepID=UPI00082697FE|nr:VOC family protein [Mucilaginibacter sp. PPCGB 2223]OCX52644.1 glyoxalase [Mucilaginibacter sp. PPCGB 2223]
MFSYNEAFSGFSVNDLQQAKTFYGDVLDLKVTEQKEGLDLDIGNGTHVFIYPKPNHQPATFTILNFKVSDVEKAVDELTAKGIKFEHYTGQMQTDDKGIFRKGGPLIAWFKDPAGNFISVIQA